MLGEFRVKGSGFWDLGFFWEFRIEGLGFGALFWFIEFLLFFFFFIGCSRG